MKREELLKSPEYWQTKLQLQLYDKVQSYIANKGITKSEFAKELGVSKGYVTQLLSGDYDHRLSKYVELLLSIGVVPKIDFVNLEDVIEDNGITTKNEPIVFKIQPMKTVFNSRQKIDGYNKSIYLNLSDNCVA